MSEREQPVQLQFSVGLQKLPEKPPATEGSNKPVVAVPVPATDVAPPADHTNAYLMGGSALLVLGGLAYWWWMRSRRPQLPAPLMNWNEPVGPESLISIPFTPADRTGPMPLPGESQNPDLRYSRGGFASSTNHGTPSSRPAAGDYPDAIMVELHDLKRKLKRFRANDDNIGAINALTRHINSRRRTSPWVFLELLRLLQRTDNTEPWLPMKPLFQLQFGQTAPDENKLLRADSLEDDIGLCLELTRLWPSTSTRAWIERWMLGTGTPIGSGPPLLTLQTYRDLLWVDEFLHHLTREAIDKRVQKMQAGQ